MRLLVFGATGGTGQALLSQGLEQGHRMTALVRNPAALEARTWTHDCPGRRNGCGGRPACCGRPRGRPVGARARAGDNMACCQAA